MPPIDPEPNDEERLEEVEGDDGSTPLSLPDDIPGAASQSTHPQTDDINDIQEAYDAGIPAEAGLPEEFESKNRPLPPDQQGFDTEPPE